ncbi:Hypothetical protein SRAE_0000067300 [Strongyloides ratti]|uniref:Uncharacterized protein n=1 Tax=Strongyloides ratti TaxID=34506 RepID=A0A090L089_STRRB|nr:Hypothetical protein SRAE_0000067300 [Strongyloides ratti]CEF61552.1 Hypothetical protein SRAE_0000067300 [Strongyloides ratti]
MNPCSACERHRTMRKLHKHLVEVRKYAAKLIRILDNMPYSCSDEINLFRHYSSMNPVQLGQAEMDCHFCTLSEEGKVICIYKDSKKEDEKK